MSRYTACPVCGKEVPLDFVNSHLDSNECTTTTTTSTTSTASATLGTKRKREPASICVSLSSDDDDDDDDDDGKPSKMQRPLQSGVNKSHVPLAERVRPTQMEEMEGQDELIGPTSLIGNLISQGIVPSLILVGPPGCGKTTLARVIQARVADTHAFRSLSAVSATLKKVREELDRAANTMRLTKRPTVLFLDEIHRFSKLQQDVFLPAVESGAITLVAATTENPGFYVNNALLSRSRVVSLSKLTCEQVVSILQRAITVDPLLQTSPVSAGPDTLMLIAQLADGDARKALGALELALSIESGHDLSKDSVKKAFSTKVTVFDRDGDSHYDTISALHKSIRGSDVDASLYYLGLALAGGEKPEFLCRRLIRMASEDVGLADPKALGLCVDALHASRLLGMPESDVILAQTVAYLALAPKSVSVYKAFKRVKAHIADPTSPVDPIPLHIRNAPHPVLKDLGHSVGYVYPPDATEAESRSQAYLPPSLASTKFWLPAVDDANLGWTHNLSSHPSSH